MLGSVAGMANDLEYGAEPGHAQGVDPQRLVPRRELLDRAVAEGHGDEDLAVTVRLIAKD
jgi:hypothetical protein